jgi:hypothetical protein
MTPSASRCLLAFVLVLGVSRSTAPAVEPIPPEQFERLLTIIKPAPTEDRWAQIPWMTDLWEARQRAAAQGKPLLVWEMDGHPLACV